MFSLLVCYINYSFNILLVFAIQILNQLFRLLYIKFLSVLTFKVQQVLGRVGSGPILTSLGFLYYTKHLTLLIQYLFLLG